MFDAKPATDKHNDARGHTLLASLKPVFWRAPRWVELLICALYAGAGWMWWDVPENALLIRGLQLFLLLRGLQLISHYAEYKWPDEERRERYQMGLSLALFTLPFAIGIGKDLVQSPPTWEQTWIAIAIFAGAVAWFAPMMWSLDRVFKPWAKRSGDKVAPAIVFVFGCGCWFSVSMFGLLYFTGKLSA